MRTTTLTLTALACVLLATPRASADFQKGVAAYKAQEHEAAFRHWKPLAERGDRESQLGIGALYERGHGVEADLAEAHKWYVLAWDRQVPGAKRRALALRKRLGTQLLEDSSRRIEAWRTAFEAQPTPPVTTARGDMRAFRKDADRRTRHHPENNKLRVLCSAQIKGDYVTFVTEDGKRVLLVAFTPNPLVDASKDISLDVVIIDKRTHRPPPSATMDYAYVYDRNGDGFVDYFTYLDGPNPILPDPRPRHVPQLTRPISKHELLFTMRNTQMLFWHAADDNFDGKADGYAVGTRNDVSGWIDGHIVVQSTRFDGHFDRCHYEPTAQGAPTSACRAMERGYFVPGRSITGLRAVPPGFDWIPLITKAIRKCGLTSRHFRRE